MDWFEMSFAPLMGVVKRRVGNRAGFMMYTAEQNTDRSMGRAGLLWFITPGADPWL